MINPIANDLDATLAALADPTRRRVIEVLRTAPRRAGDLAEKVEMSRPALSRHLRVLRQSGLVDVDTLRGDAREMARVTVWEPGARLVLRDTRDTDIEVTFEASADATKVTLEHSGLERLAPAEAESHARFGGRLLIAWFSEYLRERTPV